MECGSGNTTDLKLLKRVTDWRDDLAWAEFFKAYDPWVRRWIGSHRLSGDQAEELTQKIWVELASRIRTFLYDPSRKFRGWLRRLIQFRTRDLLRELEQSRPSTLGDASSEALLFVDPASPSFGDDESGSESDCAKSSERLVLLNLAERAQEAVRARVAPDSWQAFWLIAIDNWSIRDTARHLNKTYAAAFRNHQRVGQMLQKEGQRLLSMPIALRLRHKPDGRDEATSASS